MAILLQIILTPSSVVVIIIISHTVCPKRYKAEVEALFPGVETDKMLVVPTCQHAKMDLVQTGDNVEQEKDYCLEKVRRDTHTQFCDFVPYLIEKKKED